MLRSSRALQRASFASSYNAARRVITVTQPRRVISTATTVTPTPAQKKGLRANGKSNGIGIGANRRTTCSSSSSNSSGTPPARGIATRHISSDELRRELQEDTHSRASGTALPASMIRDIDAVESSEGPNVRDTVELGGSACHGSNARIIAVTLPGRDAPLELDAVAARDSCVCPLCVDVHSKQKNFQLTDIPADISADWTLSPDAQELEIRWRNDVPGFPAEHKTTFSLKPVENAVPDSIYHPLEPVERRIWDSATITAQNKWTDYNEYMTSDTALESTLSHLGRYGLVFLHNVPDSEDSVENVISRIGIPKRTFYGQTFDVKSRPQAKNIAYTHQRLGLHMDLMYVTNPPHLQLLHSLRARSPGGASIFSDSLRAAHALFASDPAAFAALASLPVPFHYRNDSQSYFKWRPTIELAAPLAGRSPNPAPLTADPTTTTTTTTTTPPIKCINYSPQFQAPLLPSTLLSLPPSSSAPAPYSPAQTRRLHAALRKFTALVEAPDALFELRLEEGQCVIFDNRRVLHARRAFDASKGERWLRGAYVDDDVFFSRGRVLRGEGVGA
ncbi:uncharacterized protein K452DRAFT_282654 [Aplosporella prunicola CBS 121167]|uniref:TauD/TfdA-like domain-containing protein n=1 Tax=Aplosporella prunicola CBS 121167 TaxID=1176127 RepID=A0A6A6BR50_9PEZI|nr:uncharacterized protein K452DRAFT_282654 [Aplosporella prunicola CBS 121167]KAF2146480.1 hypothetical protein K452DRAFT_282654 [Aplosporella prunicola CBS 121167]